MTVLLSELCMIDLSLSEWLQNEQKEDWKDAEKAHRNAACLPPAPFCTTCISSWRLMYLPVSICRNALSEFNPASKDLWDRSVHIHLFSHNLNFGLGKISVCHVSFSRWKRWQLTTCWISLCESPTQEFWCRQGCTPHWPKSAWLDLPSCLDFVVVLQASCSLCIHFLTNSVVINMQGITRIATVASLCLHDVIINLCAYSKS